jgi:hypothetical protein
MRLSRIPDAVPAALATEDVLRRLAEPRDELVAFADPGPDSRIVLIGPDPSPLACALAARGCGHVSVPAPHDRPGSADVVFIAGVAGANLLARSVSNARRLLAPLGTVAIRLCVEPDDALVRHASHAMFLHGFTRLKARVACGDTLLRADVPLFGRPGCA